MHLQGCDSGMRLKTLNLDFFSLLLFFKNYRYDNDETTF